MPVVLDRSRVLLDRAYTSKQDVIRAIGDVMLAHGDVTPRYVAGMLEKEAQCSTWVTDSVALPHGTEQVRAEIARDSVVVVQLPQGVEWGNGKTVRLAIGLAGKGDQEHLELLAALAGVLQHRDKVERLIGTDDPGEVIGLLAEEVAS